MPDEAFSDLLIKVRAGDAAALSDLVRHYEPEVRLAVRALLGGGGLRRHFDSLDVVQAVLVKFCTHAAAGRFDLQSPAQLLALLNRMAYNSFLDRVRHEGAQERDYRRAEAGDVLEGVRVASPGPGSIAGWRDEHREIRRRLTDAERLLAARWARGESWVEVGGPGRAEQDRARHRFEAAFERVAGQLTRLRGEEVRPDYLKAVYRWVEEQGEP